MNKIKNSLEKIYYRLYLGIDTPADDLIKIVYFVRSLLTGEDRYSLYQSYLERKIMADNLKGDRFVFKDILLPDFSKDGDYMRSFVWTYFDILFFYLKRNDNYDSKTVDLFEKNIETEGLYCYAGNGFDMTIKKGDVVVDAGAWVGPFSGYASKKGAKVYAFEPSSKNLGYLKQTADFNGNIEVVPKGLYDKSATLSFSEDCVGSHISMAEKDGQQKCTIETTTLDDFVKQNNIKRIDFIKSDIEGSERNMLIGSVWVLKNFAPKLSICTYHLKDDPEVLAKIILKANPKYRIFQRKMKLYAQV